MVYPKNDVGVEGGGGLLCQSHSLAMRDSQWQSRQTVDRFRDMTTDAIGRILPVRLYPTAPIPPFLKMDDAPSA